MIIEQKQREHQKMQVAKKITRIAGYDDNNENKKNQVIQRKFSPRKKRNEE